MAHDLAQLMRFATEDLVLPSQAATDAITGFHRKRRRRLAAAAVVTSCAVAAAVALPLTTTDSSGRHDVNRVVPASPSATIVPLASVSGVDVTYLPTGFVVRPDFAIGAMVKENGHTSVSQYYYRPVPANAGANGPVVSLAIQRGYTADLDAFAAESKGSTETWTTVGGKRALLQTFPADTTGGYELTWLGAPDVTVTVFSSGPVPLTEVMRVAEGLVVHPMGPVPANPAAATDAIRDVVMKAFNGGQPADVSMGAIENGQQLSSVLAELKRLSPAMTQAAEVTAVHVTFVAANQAVAQTSISYPVPGPANANTEEVAEADVTVDFNDGHWLVSQSSYCSVVSTLVHGCPSG
jgi:hypothetical protein